MKNLHGIELSFIAVDEHGVDDAWRRRDGRAMVMARRYPPVSALRMHRARTDGRTALLRRIAPCRLNAWLVSGAGWIGLPLAVQAAAAIEPAAAWSGARLAHGSLLVGGLQPRLGEIRHVMPTAALGGETFVRYTDGRFQRSAGSGDRGARMRGDAWQVGAGLAYWEDDGASHRAGWSLDRGGLRLRARSGLRAHDDVTGLSAWYTQQRDDGRYVDAVLRRASHAGQARGDIAADAQPRARQWTYSLEAGAPWPLGANATIEPRVQLKYQSLHAGKAPHAWQGTARVGARIARVDNERFVPYAQIDLERQLAGQRRVGAAPSITLRNGTSVRLGAGVTIRLHRTVDFYADAGWQRRMAGGGGTGGSVNAGMRIDF